MEKEIIGICGDGPLAEIELIGNDPNFVFVNDVSFPTVVLYNDQGSVINVNSWLECVHYLQGGWVSNQINNFAGSKYIAVSLTIVSIIVTGLVLYKNKKYNEIN